MFVAHPHCISIAINEVWEAINELHKILLLLPHKNNWDHLKNKENGAICCFYDFLQDLHAEECSADELSEDRERHLRADPANQMSPTYSLKVRSQQSHSHRRCSKATD